MGIKEFCDTAKLEELVANFLKLLRPRWQL